MPGKAAKEKKASDSDGDSGRLDLLCAKVIKAFMGFNNFLQAVVPGSKVKEPAGCLRLHEPPELTKAARDRKVPLLLESHFFGRHLNTLPLSPQRAVQKPQLGHD